MRSTVCKQRQGGSALIEALVAVLVFSFGILALVSMQTAAIKSTADAKYRADASFLANQIVGQMWGVDSAVLADFVNGPALDAACSVGATAATNEIAEDWLDSLEDLLPGADANRQTILFDADGVLTVRVCWLDKSDRAAVGTYHNHVVTAQINKNL